MSKPYVVTTLYTGHKKAIVHVYGPFTLLDARKFQKSLANDITSEQLVNFKFKSWINKTIQVDPETGVLIDEE